MASNPILLTVPDRDQVHSTHIDDPNLPQLPKAAQYCHVIPDLAKDSLLSIVKLCKSGCKVPFTKLGIDVEVRYRGRPILAGSTYTKTGVWCTISVCTPLHVPICSSSLLTKSSEQYLGNTTQMSSQEKLAIYHHQVMGSPPRPSLHS